MGYIKPGKVQQEMDVLKFYLMDNGVLYVIVNLIYKMLMLYVDNLDFQVTYIPYNGLFLKQKFL